MYFTNISKTVVFINLGDLNDQERVIQSKLSSNTILIFFFLQNSVKYRKIYIIFFKVHFHIFF